MISKKEYDVFIAHASEDKKTFVRPLSNILKMYGVKVWYDEFALEIGDSLSSSIDKGLANSSYGLVVLSKAFIRKKWSKYELQGLTSKEIEKGKVILPIWHKITREELLDFSPPLADKFALNTDKYSLNEIALSVLKTVRPDIFNNLLRLIMWEKMKERAETERVPIKNIKSSPIRHKTLSDRILIRLRIIHHVINEVLSISFDEMVDNFRRDVNPQEELFVWEKLVVAYLTAISGKNFSSGKRKKIFSIMLLLSIGNIDTAIKEAEAHFKKQEIDDFFYIYKSVFTNDIKKEK